MISAKVDEMIISIDQNPFEYEALKIIFKERFRNEANAKNTTVSEDMIDWNWRHFIKKYENVSADSYEDVLIAANEQLPHEIDESIDYFVDIDKIIREVMSE